MAGASTRNMAHEIQWHTIFSQPVLIAVLESNYESIQDESGVNKFFILVATTLLILFTIPANAKEIKGLYQADTAVASQSTRERRQALKALLGKVLIKVSGQSNVVENPDIIRGVKKAVNMVTEFSFQRRDNQLMLSATFDSVRVDGLLKEANIPVWGSLRPSVMVWMGIEDNGQRRVISETEHGNLLDTINNVADVRGLPLLLPVMDLEDQMNIDINDIWGRFSESVAKANLRYGTDYLIIAKVAESTDLITEPTVQLGDGYQPVQQAGINPHQAMQHAISQLDNHQLDQNSESQESPLVDITADMMVEPTVTPVKKTLSWSIYKAPLQVDAYDPAPIQLLNSGIREFSNPEDAIEALVNLSTDYFASQYGISQQLNNDRLVLAVNNVSSIDTLVAIERYLLSLKVVEQVGIEKLSGQTVSFKIKLLGNEQDLVAVLGLDKRLQAAPMNGQFDAVSYRWQEQ